MVIFAIVLERDVTKCTVTQMIVTVFMPIRTLVDKSRYVVLTINIVIPNLLYKFANKKYEMCK